MDKLDLKGVIVKGFRGTVDSVMCLVGLVLLLGLWSGGCRKIPQKLSVCEAQGGGLESPYLGREVVLRGLVSADLLGVEPGGLVILDEDCPLNEAGSRGIFIMIREGLNNVSVGDEIRVRGFIREYAGETRLEVDSQNLEILSLNNVLPDAVDLGDFLAPPLLFGYEKWEGQLVSIPRVDLQWNLEDPDRIMILPEISPGPGVELVCFRAESFTLGIDANLLDLEVDPFQPGYHLEDLVGLIRQDQHGYYLQLMEKPHWQFKEGDHLAGGDSAVPDTSNERTSESKSGSPTVPAGDPSPTVNSTLVPSYTPLPPPVPTAIPSPTYYPIQLLISEVLPNPSGDEPGGEWIEIYNPSRGWLLLNGIKIGDEISPDGNEGLLRFPDGYYLEGGQTLVIANQARLFESYYGFLPDFELENSDPRVPDLHPYYKWGRNTVKLSNTGDEVLLLDPWDRMLDLVVYGKSGRGGFSPPADAPKEGHSLERYPPNLDQGQASDWREQSDPSPGELDHSTPTVQVTQTLPVSPSPTFSNFTGSPVVTSIVSPQPGGTFTPVSTFTSTPENTPAQTQDGTEAPTPSATESTPIPASATQPATTPSATSTDQDTPSHSITPAGSVTPSSEPTSSVTPGPLILINEILVDPDPLLGDSNGDGQISTDDDEFLELVNISGQALDLSGWQILDAIRTRYTFSEGTILSPDCGVVVFGGGSPSGGFGGSLVFTTGSLGLNNTGDLVSVFDGDGQEVALISYGSEGNQDQSLNRNPDLSGFLPLILHGEVPGSGGVLFSPGTRVDGSAFGACP